MVEGRAPANPGGAAEPKLLSANGAVLLAWGNAPGYNSIPMEALNARFNLPTHDLNRAFSA